MSDFLLPDVGEGLTEAEIVTWHVAVGDVVVVNQALVDIETAKSVVELPSPFAGTVVALKVAEGDTVEVGTPIISIEESAVAATAPEPALDPTPDPTSDPTSESAELEIDLSNPAASGGAAGESLVGRTKEDRGPVRRARKRAAPPQAAQEARARAVPPAEERPVRVRTKPLVRRLARDLGVDLASVAPTGPEGTVTRDDVLAVATGAGAAPAAEATAVAPVAAATGSAAPATPQSSTSGTRVPVKGLTRAMAEAMTSSAFTAPHVTEWITVDCSAAVAWVHQVRERREFAGLRVTPTLLVAKACIAAMRRTPEINSSFVTHADGTSEVVLHSHVNLGLAAATPRGLVVPNVKDAHTLDLHGLATAVTDLVDTAKAGRTQPTDLADGTFTITNVGTFGVDGGTPIINPGESAILAVGAVGRRPWVDPVTDELVVRDVVTLSLSFDHRHVDGEKGSRFLTDVARVLGDPASVLLL